MPILQYTDPETFQVSEKEFNDTQYAIAEDIRDRVNSPFPIVPGKDGKLYVLYSSPTEKIRIVIEVMPKD